MKQSILICLFISLIFQSCSTNTKQDSAEKTNTSANKLADKQEPYDHEVLRFFGPEPTEKNIKAYYKANQLAIQEATQKSDIFGGEWTLQGPGNIGGCVNAIATDPNNAATIYAGFSRGGLWKSEDAGVNWSSIWDGMSTRAISEIAIDPNNSNIIYVGTGDENISGTPYVGNGIYKSINAGENWINIGLEDAYIISDIMINPTNSNEVTASSMGLPFVKNTNRGIYKSVDGGATWNQTLIIDEVTGVSELTMSFDQPDIQLAGAWSRIRTGKESIVSGEGSGVFRTADNGDTWDKLSFDVPDTMGRTAVQFSTTTEGLAYAMFITKNHAYHSLHKSTDYGATWTAIDLKNDETPTMMGGFAWYFGRIASLIDPEDGQEKLYLCGVDLWAFDEEIKEWTMKTPPWWEYSVHADKHAIEADADGNLLVGTDGGLYRNDGSTWQDIENIPANMFYRVGYNPFLPEFYYGGMQDNGSSGGNADDINNWARIFGGDGFEMLFDDTDPAVSYVETQRGNIYYSDDGQFYNYMDQYPVDDDRRNWDMQFIISPHNNNVLYTGTYRAVKIDNTNGFYEWIPISDQLTDDVEFVTSYHTITSLDESPIEEGLLYYGTADGNVWRAEGEDFVSISDGLPKFYISSIKSSPSEVDRVYVTISSFLFNDNTARIYRSADRGENWEAIGTGLPSGAVNDVIIYDQYQDSILFAATQIGVYASLDAGTTWDRLGEDMPFVPVRDMVINEEYNQIVAGTYGSSIYSYPIDSLISEFTKIDVANKDEELVGISVFPNPIVDAIHIVSSEKTSVEIFNVSGQLMSRNSMAVRHAIDCSNFVAGTYFVHVKNKNGKPVVKQLIKN